MLVRKIFVRWLMTLMAGVGLIHSSFGLNFYIFSSHESKFLDCVGSDSETEEKLPTSPRLWTLQEGYSIKALPLEGHKFLGWYTKLDGWGYSDPSAGTANDQITPSTTISYEQVRSAGTAYDLNVVVAKYVPVFAVSVRAEPAEVGGTVSISPTSVDGTYEQNAQITLTANASEDYEFSHWEMNGKKVEGPEGDSTLKLTVTQEAKYVAKFVEKVVYSSLTVNPNGGYYDEVGFSKKYVNVLSYHTTNCNQILVAERNGYRLDGYYDGESEKVYDATGRFVGSSTYWDADGRYLMKTDLFVEARWVPESSTVTLNAEDGTGATETISAEFDSDLPKVVPPTRNGYAFRGYFTERNGQGDQYYDSDGTGKRKWDLPGDRTLYASWIAQSYKLTVLSEPEGTTVCERNYQTATTNQTVEIVLPEKPGYAIAGWTAAGDFSGDDPTVEGAAVTIPSGSYGNIELTPQWVTQSYFVAFDGNGATAEAMPEQEFLQGVPQALSSNTFVRAGYAFGGWTNLLASVRYDDGAVVTDIAALGTTNTLKALWTANAYRVRFYGNGGTNTMSDQSFAYGEAQELTRNAFVRAGYDFAGWATDPTNGVAFADGASVSNLTTTADGEVPLFAKWTTAVVGLANPLSIAADCATNLPDRVACELEGDRKGFCIPVTVSGSDQDAGGNGQYVKLNPEGDGDQAILSMQLKGPGTLRFSYKTCVPDYDPNYDDTSFLTMPNGVLVKTNVDCWAEGEFVMTSETTELICWYFDKRYSTQDTYACVDNIRWVPERREEGLTVGVTFRLNDGTPPPADIVTNLTCTAGEAIGALPDLEGTPDLPFVGWTYGGKVIDENWIVPLMSDGVQLLARWGNGHPEPGPDDAAVISAAGVKDGKFTLSFTSDERFDYNLLTNANLLIDSWGVMDKKAGTGTAITFDPPIVDGLPQLFYKVETIQRQD